MFNIIRRISNGVILRPDRPWAEDATSNAPTKGKKRSLERNADVEAMEDIKTKKIRGESIAGTTPELESQHASAPKIEHEKQEEKYVKEATKGVNEVELNAPGSGSGSPSKAVKPESVPLPGEDDIEELEGGADVSSTLEAGPDDSASSADGEIEGPLKLEPKAQEEEDSEEKKAEEVTEATEKETKKTEAAMTEAATTEPAR